MIGVEAGPVHCPGLLLKGRDPSRCCLSFQAAPSPSMHPSSGWSLNGLEGCGAGDPGIPGQRVGDVRPDQPRARQLTCLRTLLGSGFLAYRFRKGLDCAVQSALPHTAVGSSGTVRLPFPNRPSGPVSAEAAGLGVPPVLLL